MWGKSTAARTISRAHMNRDSEIIASRGNGIYGATVAFGPTWAEFLVIPDQRESYISRNTMISFGLGPYLDTMEINGSTDIGGAAYPVTRFPLPWIVIGGAQLYAVDMRYVHGLDIHNSLGADFLDHFNWRRAPAQITLTR